MDSDSDSDNIDIASALLGGATKNKSSRKVSSTSRPSSTTTTTTTNSSKKGKNTQRHQQQEEEVEDVDDSDDEIFASLSQLQHSRNLSEGAALVRKGKDTKSSKTLTGGGSFQALGLAPLLLKTLLQRGFTTPTPIQRLALPSILGTTETVVTDQGKKLTVARDHLCMARTGSGKTLCYLLPLLSRLWTHSEKFGARGLILVPTRELAMQVLKVGKDLARGIRGEGEQLRWAMVVGGEAMEAQFETISGNPDV
jgi:ATP-dependent RNA helicase DDX54/DBP10